MKRTIQPIDFCEEPPGRPRRARLPNLDLLEVEDVAPFFGVKPAAIRKRIRLGQLGPWSRQGRRWTVRRTTLERWLDSQEEVIN